MSGGSSQVSSSSRRSNQGEFFVVIKVDAWTVVFRKTSSSVISVKDTNGIDIVKGNVTIGDDCTCKIKVHGQELEFWQFRKRALEDFQLTVSFDHPSSKTMAGPSKNNIQGGTIWHMSDHEKFEQIGRLAEEVSQVKGKLAHVNEKLNRAQSDYNFLADTSVFHLLKVQDGKLITPNMHGQFNRTLENLLSAHELAQTLEEKERLTNEFNELTARLKAVVPHLL